MKCYKKEWKKKASKLIRNEIAKRNITLKEVYDNLVKNGEKTTYQNFTMKLNKGTFPTYLLLKIADFLKIKELELNTDKDKKNEDA